MVTSRIVVLGAGFGGLELAASLSAEFGDDLDLVLIDKAKGSSSASPSWTSCSAGARPPTCSTGTRTSVKPGVRFVRRRSASIDPARQAGDDRRRRVRGRHPRRGARRGPRPVRDAGADRGRPRVLHRRWRVRAARRTRRLRRRPRRRRRDVDTVQVPAGAERDRAADARPAAGQGLLRRRRTCRWSCRWACRSRRPRPLRRPILAAFAERGISWHPGQLVRALDPDRKVAVLGDGGEMRATTCSSGFPSTGRPTSSSSRDWPSTAGSRSTRSRWRRRSPACTRSAT